MQNKTCHVCDLPATDEVYLWKADKRVWLCASHARSFELRTITEAIKAYETLRHLDEEDVREYRGYLVRYRKLTGRKWNGE